VRRARRVALVAASVAVAIVVLVGVLAYLASRNSDRLLAAVGRGLGRDVHVDAIGFTVRGGAGVVLSGVRIADDPAFGSDPFLTTARIELRLHLGPLFRRRLVVDRVLIDEPVVNLVRDKSGRMNVDTLGKGPAPPAAASAKKTPAAPAGPPSDDGTGSPAAGPPAFQLALLHIHDATLRYLERSTGRTVELRDVDIEARQPRFAAPIPIRLRARFATDDVHLDGIESEGVLELGEAQPRYHGSLSAASGALGKVAIGKLTAEVRAAPPVIDLESATVELLGGSARGNAHLASEGENAGVNARVEARDIDLGQLPTKQSGPRPQGTLDIDGKLAGPPPGAPDFKTAATADGGFTVNDGRIVGVQLGKAVLDVLSPFLKQGKVDRLRERYPELFGDELRFTKLSGTGRLAGGRIRTEDFVIAGASYEGSGEGSLGLDGDIDAVVRLAASRALTEDLLSDDRARAALVDSRGQMVIPLRVRGPVRRPRVTPDPSFATAAARGLLGGTGLEGLAGDVIDRFLGGRKKKER
jgi:AsmA-like C-terminal region